MGLMALVSLRSHFTQATKCLQPIDRNPHIPSLALGLCSLCRQQTLASGVSIFHGKELWKDHYCMYELQYLLRGLYESVLA